MGKFDIDRPIAELFSVEPYALRIRNVCNSHDIATIRELCLHSKYPLIPTLWMIFEDSTFAFRSGDKHRSRRIYGK